MTGKVAEYCNTHPRPQMKREEYYLLNGEWELDGATIIVPYPPQSKLSEYKKEINDNLTYKKEFFIPDNFTKERILLHFGGVDQYAEVLINDKCVGSHKGGYLPFCFDITDYIYRDKVNIITVKVEDTLSKIYPYGKQCKKRGGMWYTPVSGIWQSVWLENVPQKYISDIRLTPDLQGLDIELEGSMDIEGFEAIIVLEDGDKITCKLHGNKAYIAFDGLKTDGGKAFQAKYWTPDTPFLYNMIITTAKDRIETYFALRTIGIKEISGVRRVCLNGKPVFLHGVLDQGYFEEGIYLPKHETDYEKDILNMKELGFNMLRKHIKIEPEIFYYYCDKHGMLVIQDMVNSGEYSFIRDTAMPTIGFSHKRDDKPCKNEQEMERRRMFEANMSATLKHLYNHPCVVVYTIFNEGWGQFEADRMYDIAKKTDSTRLYDSTSGWFIQKKSDFDSEHIYFRTKKLKVKERPLIVSECGGYTYQVSGHTFNSKKTYGYGKCKDSTELTDTIVSMYEKMIIPSIKAGVCGCVYTQLCDVEEEINGLYTYDRQICKVDKKALKAVAKRIQDLIK